MRTAKGLFTLLVCAVAALVAPRTALAEKVLQKGDGWEVYTDGRAAGFVSYARGDGFPQPLNAASPTGALVQVHDVRGGGFDVIAQRQLRTDGVLATDGTPLELTQGTVDTMRVRSGLIGNTLGVGVRGLVTPWTTATAYIQIWAFVESESRQKNRPNYADVRQGYAKLEGPWGMFLAGRTRTLFSRGATDIDVMYAHRYGVGFPGNIDSNGPSLGHIGFGVLGSGFAAGLLYATPSVGGLQLTMGVFDPIELQGGGWIRTRFGRPEAELTFERRFGDTGKVVLFANGGYQKVYKANACPSMPGVAEACSLTAAGVGYGGRFEVGPFHLGVAGHYGQGLGLNYALEVSDANLDAQNSVRRFDGYYVQSQLSLRRFDVSLGWGITRVFLNDVDNLTVQDPRDPMNAAAQVIPHSVIKHQMGASGVVVFHMTPSVHFDADVFRAEAAWFLGEKQVIWVFNSGMVYTW